MSNLPTVFDYLGLTQALKEYQKLSPEEQERFAYGMSILVGCLGYAFIRKPEILPESIKGIGEITKGIGEMVPL